ncbi:MAG TPA: signal peptidase I [Lachnospiraceae bacterium]|nr:signal peptidase I [Lachnospiraceae bacterium]
MSEKIMNAKCTKNPEEIIEEKRARISQKRTIFSFFIKLVIIVGMIFAIFHYVYGFLSVSGNDMYPRILDGDFIFYYRRMDKIEIGDIVVFHADGGRRIGRVVAQGQDIVEIGSDGTLIINGSVQDEEIFYPTYERGNNVTYPYQVPEGSYFILCDYRTESVDSRTFGSVYRSSLEGKVISIFRRRDM